MKGSPAPAVVLPKARGKLRLGFALTPTKEARKCYGAFGNLKSKLNSAARLVADLELSTVTLFSLSVILMSDDELLEINRDSLGHDYYTDIITFEIDRSEDELEAELYISVDRARDNSKRATVTLEVELVHLIIHGVLHLAGYDDKTPADKKQMRAKERLYLAKL